MAKRKSPGRRDFLRRSGMATLTALTGPASFSLVSCGKAGEPIEESKSSRAPAQPRVEDYASVEAICNGVPIWSFSKLCYIYGLGPDLMPGVVMQEGNRRPIEKLKLKKSWEIKHNLCGSEHEMTLRSRYNESQPQLPIHLIDGDPNTVWASWEFMVPNARPEWIRIDLPLETEVASVALVCAQKFPCGNYGRLLPKALEVKTSRDAWHWETVYSNKRVPLERPVLQINFRPHRAKQIWIVGSNFQTLRIKTDSAPWWRYTFSIGEVEVRDPAGNNLALASRGASVTVSSTSYGELDERMTAEALWEPLQYDLGNKWLRIGGDNGSFMWHYVEHEKGKLEIDPRADQSITDLVQHGVQVILNLDFKGNWIYENPPRKTNWLEARFREVNDSYNDPLPAADANPEMYQGYFRYVEYMVRRFKDRVSYFEIGNEWNGWFGAEHYLKTWFEPTYRIVKQIAPSAKVMLGSPAGFDRNVILDCLGIKRRSGISEGKLILDAGAVEGASWLPERGAGALAVREDINAQELTANVDCRSHGEAGIVLRYKDPKNFLAALYSALDRSIFFYEVLSGDWGKKLGEKKITELGSQVKLVAQVRGPSATLTVSDGARSFSTGVSVKHINEAGRVGLMQHRGTEPELFGNFVVVDQRGNTLVKDSFDGPNGTIPAGWKYVTGGPNPIAPGVASKIDAIGWHPTHEPNAAYFSSVRVFQKQCQALGFRGRFFATEIYAGAVYPPGPKPGEALHSSETQMAKYLAKSLVGHNGLGMEAGPCNLHFTGYALSQPLCQVTWPMQTLHPFRPTMAYYMWRNVATAMDDFHPVEFPVHFSEGQGLVFFTFRRGDNERMVCVWINGPEKDEINERKSDITFRGARAKRAMVVDIMNGTEQELDHTVDGDSTLLKALRIKDYPVFVRISL